MGKDIDNILEEYYQKRIDLLEVRTQLLLLYNVRLSLLNDIKNIAFGNGSTQERMEEIKQAFNDVDKI